ncbi:hypothetical protein [uncultured Winogradskyella sp.]|uniref:hypothetical protein n=1 Tax=uncultured Winogradskyella sp. TaxID=395353 RepID=UPI0030DA4760|tara:strand:+ start:4975 stop:5712 length:738 start_codon:yes stop_codon:yes gene_type:complete
MLVNKILKVVLLLLGGIFILFQGFAFEIEGAAVSSLALVLLTILYCKWTENKSIYFFWFLVTFTFAHLLSYSAYYGPLIEEGSIDYFYYSANILYITAYIFLIIKILIGLNLKIVFSELAIPVFILIILDIFCVYIVSATTENVLSIYEYSLELAYNAVIMVLLSVALINYMYRNDNKSMLFLLGSICIVFSEIIQLAYFYILNNNDLGFIYSFLLVIAFVFLYLQSQLDFTGPEPEYIDEQIEI